MSIRKQALAAGAVGLLVALAAIAGMLTFLPLNSNLPANTGSTISTQASYSASSTAQSVSSSTGVEGNQGQLDVLMTDPPTVPSGVTGVYVTYTNVAVHVSGAGNKSGWTIAHTTGTLDLMKLVNVTTTIAAVKVTTGFYNALRFNISSAEVAFSGKNYTAFVPDAVITVVIPGGIQVNATKSSAAIIDMSPTVLNIGSNSDPEFIINVATRCVDVPPSVFVKDMDDWGFVFHMTGLAWWKQINEQYTSSIQITAATLTGSSLSVTIKNIGSRDATLSVLSVAPPGSQCAPQSYPQSTGGPSWLPMCFTDSAFFVILSNGTLRPEVSLLPSVGPGMHDETPMDVFSAFGYTLLTGHSVTLTYTGAVSFGFAFGGQTPPGVIKGDQYSITAIGLQVLARYVMVAS